MTIYNCVRVLSALVLLLFVSAVSCNPAEQPTKLPVSQGGTLHGPTIKGDPAETRALVSGKWQGSELRMLTFGSNDREQFYEYWVGKKRRGPIVFDMPMRFTLPSLKEVHHTPTPQVEAVFGDSCVYTLLNVEKQGKHHLCHLLRLDLETGQFEFLWARQRAAFLQGAEESRFEVVWSDINLGSGTSSFSLATGELVVGGRQLEFSD